MCHLQAGAGNEQRRRKVPHAAGAGRTVIQLAGPRPDEIDELLDGLCRDRGVHPEHERVGAQDGNRREVLQRVVAHLLDQGRDQELRRGREEQRVAVGRRPGDELGGDRAACAWAVIDDELLAERRCQPLGNDACLDVDAAAGRVGHDDPDRPLRPRLGLGELGRERSGHCQEKQP